MDDRVLDEVTGWESRAVADGYAGLRSLADEGFTGAVEAGRAWAFVLNGRVVGVVDGRIESFDGAPLSVYEAPDPSLPLLYAMQSGESRRRASYFTDDTPLSEADATLSEGGFTGYVELSENVLSGDYYVVYYGGRSLPVAFVGSSRRLLTGDEAFERADDEVGIYEVREADVRVLDVPEPEPEPDPGSSAEPEPEPDPGPDRDAGSSPSGAGASGGAAGPDDADPAAGVDADGAESPFDDGYGPDLGGGPGGAREDAGGTEAGSGTEPGVEPGSHPGRDGDGPEPAGTSADGTTTDLDAESVGGRESGPAPESDAASGESSTGRPDIDLESSLAGESASRSDGDGSEGDGPGEAPEPRSTATGGDAEAAGSDADARADAGGGADPGGDADLDGGDAADRSGEPSGAGADADRAGDAYADHDEGVDDGGVDADVEPDRGGGADDPPSTEASGEARPEATDVDAAGVEARAGSGAADAGGDAATDAVGDAGGASAATGGSEAGSGGRGREADALAAEERWREDQVIPALDPAASDRAADGAEPDDEGASGGAAAGTGAGPRSEPPVGAPEGDAERGAEAAAEVGRLRARLEEVESARAEAAAERERLAAEREEVAEERDAYRERAERLAGRVNELESEVERLTAELSEARERAESGASPDAREVSPAEALRGANVFVRYGRASGATLAKVVTGDVDRDQLGENLRLEHHHTRFDDEDAVVDGEPFGEFLHDTTQYRFVEWIVRDLLFEVAETGNAEALDRLVEAVPESDRAELDGGVTVPADGGSDGGHESLSFDVVVRDRMGNPLVVADLNTSRDAATRSQMESLIEKARTVGGAKEQFAGAFLVTASFFEPAALETADAATASGGLLGGSSRRSYVKLSRRAGFHLCLVETRGGAFHMNVPEL